MVAPRVAHRPKEGSHMMSPAGAVLDSPPRPAELRTKTGRHQGPDANSEESFVRAARDIERRLIDGAGLSDTLMLQRFLQERRRAKGPLVFVDERRMMTNAAAAGLVTASDRSRLWDCAKQLLTGEQSAPAELVL